MIICVHRTDKTVCKSSVDDAVHFDSNWIVDADLSNVVDVPPRFWNITGDTITEMTESQKDVVRAERQAARRDALAAKLDSDFDRAIALVMLHLINETRQTVNDLRDAIVNANSLADVKTAAAAIDELTRPKPKQLKAAVRAKMND